MTRQLVLLAATAVLAACQAPAAETSASTAPQVQVRAGDLFAVHGRTVRLVNAQAPALPPEARCWGEAALAVQSAAKAEALLAAAEAVTVEKEGVGPDGAPLVRITLNGKRDLGEALVFAGVAARRTDRGWDWCARPDFAEVGGPGLSSGPQQNAEFMGWLTHTEAARTNHEMASSVLGAPAVQAEFYAF